MFGAHWLSKQWSEHAWRDVYSARNFGLRSKPIMRNTPPFYSQCQELWGGVLSVAMAIPRINNGNKTVSYSFMWMDRLPINKPCFPRLSLLLNLSSTQAERSNCHSFFVFQLWTFKPNQVGPAPIFPSKMKQNKPPKIKPTWLWEFSKQIRGESKGNFLLIPVRLRGGPPSTPLPWALMFGYLSTGHLDHLATVEVGPPSFPWNPLEDGSPASTMCLGLLISWLGYTSFGVPLTRYCLGPNGLITSPAAFDDSHRSSLNLSISELRRYS